MPERAPVLPRAERATSLTIRIRSQPTGRLASALATLRSCGSATGVWFRPAWSAGRRCGRGRDAAANVAAGSLL